MKILLSTLLLSALLTGASRAALTITIAPGTTGSLFTVVQTSPSPVFGTDAVTSGLVLGIPLPGQSLVQNPALVTSGSYAFSASLGTVGESGATGSTAIDHLTLGSDSQLGQVSGSLSLSGFLTISSGSSHQFLFGPGATAEVPVNFSTFVPGTFTVTDVVFGQVTAIVVPEPASLMLGLAGALPLLGRRSRRRVG